MDETGAGAPVRNGATLENIAQLLAAALQAADSHGPTHISARSGRVYQPGIGPHSENEAVRLMIREAERIDPTLVVGQFLPYPDKPRQKCDMWVGDPVDWAIEVKMARFRGDNGKPDDTALKDLLSPYESDRSALTDCSKLAGSGFEANTAVVIYGFDYGDRRLDPAIDAFELLARRNVSLGDRCEYTFGPLVHPVHHDGRLFAWQVR